MAKKEHKTNSVGWKLLPAKLLKGRCQVEFCSRKRNGRSGYCATHKRRLDRIRYPEYVFYHRLKKNAIKRGVVFEITLAEFKQWCIEVDLVAAKKSAEKRFWSVDRIKNELGYVVGNLQLMPTTENAQKAWDEDYEEHPAKKTWFQKKVEPEPEPIPIYDDDEVPF